MTTQSDFALVARTAVLHDRRAFDCLVKKYQSPVRLFFLSQTGGNAPLSDDLAQDTFIKAYTRIASFRGMAGFKTWLMRIAYNVFFDYQRKDGRRCVQENEIDEGLISNGSGNVVQTGTEGLRMDLYEALSLLKPEERSCITLQLIEGQSVTEISKITNMPEGTVKSHLSRGKKQLTAYLKENGYG